jgi:hypothetical protein
VIATLWLVNDNGLSEGGTKTLQSMIHIDSLAPSRALETAHMYEQPSTCHFTSLPFFGAAKLPKRFLLVPCAPYPADPAYVPYGCGS